MRLDVVPEHRRRTKLHRSFLTPSSSRRQTSRICARAGSALSSSRSRTDSSSLARWQTAMASVGGKGRAWTTVRDRARAAPQIADDEGVYALPVFASKREDLRGAAYSGCGEMVRRDGARRAQRIDLGLSRGRQDVGRGPPCVAERSTAWSRRPVPHRGTRPIYG
jgi:hypothetical protein